MIKDEFRFLNRLSDINNNTGIKFLHRAACPGSHCPMHMALATIRSMKGVSSLVVGMPECGYYSRFVAVTPFGQSGELHYVYELDSNEVVFGCRKGVKKALLQMEKEGAKVIVIILTCVPSLIGEDMESVIEELESEMEASVVFIDGAHFKRNGYQSGLSDTLVQLVGLIDQKESFPNSMKVNVLGLAWGEEYNDLKALITRNGFVMEEYHFGISMDRINSLANARVNLVINSKMLKPAQKLYEKYHIPYIYMAGSYTVSDITKCYEELFEVLHIKIPEDGFKGKVALENCLKLASRLKKESFISVYPELDTLAITLFLSSLGMIPELLHVEEYDENSDVFKKAINELGVDPLITYVSDNDRVSDVFTGESTYLSLGYCKGIPLERIIDNNTLRGISTLFGYERSQTLLSLIKDKLEWEGEKDGTI